MKQIEDVLLVERKLVIGSAEEIVLAVDRGEVTFPMVMKLLYLSFGSLPPDQTERYLELYRQAVAQFMKLEGGIRESFYANEFVAGVLLTQKNELFFNIWWDEFNFDTIPTRALEADINDLRLKTGLYLAEDSRKMCTARLFRLYKTLISSLRVEYYRWSGVQRTEGKPAYSAGHIADMNQLRRELDDVRDTYRRIGLERGKVLYVAAAALGAAVVVILASIAATIPPLTASLRIWSGVFAGGAIGAFLSVLERLTRGALKVQFETGLPAMMMSGISRPIVGALSGLALFVLVKGSIVLPLIKATAEADQILFFAGLAFLAGFSERLLKDVLGNAASSVAETPQQHSTANDRLKKSSEEESHLSAK